MLEKAKGLSRSGQRNAIRFLRGVYGEEGDDVFEAFMLRYPKAVVTLETALSLHGIIDEWALPPFCLSFALGYRPVKEGRIRQLWDDDKTRLLGTTRMSHGAVSFLCHDPERLLIELWRRERKVPREIYAKAIFAYRGMANSGELNLPKLREYIAKMPKARIYAERLRREIL